jgi:hypothetical protein
MVGRRMAAEHQNVKPAISVALNSGFFIGLAPMNDIYQCLSKEIKTTGKILQEKKASRCRKALFSNGNLIVEQFMFVKKPLSNSYLRSWLYICTA